jgi:TRAP-type mannitol/chloroaromatic compound transport system permease small subunit
MKLIDQINKWAGKAVSWLVPILILELVYDTVARYVLGAAYTLQIDEHVRIETFYGKMSRKSKALIDAICYVLLFFPVMAVILYFGGLFALKSWKIMEAGGDSMWQPAIYPFKTVLPVAAFLLILQGTVEFIRCVAFLVSGNDVHRKP